MTAEELLAGTVVAIDKPRQWTSFQAVNKVKSVVRNRFGLKKFKIGHAGTLDPMATGLLLVCIGRATKQIAQLQEGEKEYTGTMVFGATTPCYDLEQAIDSAYPYSHIDSSAVNAVLSRFTGPIRQLPPMFSALKIDGHRAYEYARLGDAEPLIEPRQVVVASFEITDFRPGNPARESQWLDFNATADAVLAPNDTELKSTKTPLYKSPQGVVPDFLPQADFRVRCSKGTYIRSLARDLGAALGSGAFLASLRRTRIGIYRVEQAVLPEQVNFDF